MTTLPTMRIKTRWFKPGGAKGDAEQASAMAFIVWRVARQMLERMRGAHFDIDAGPQYFAFMREVLVFLVAVTDRLAFERLNEVGGRGEFTVALVRHLARTLQESEDEWLGTAANAPSHADTFIDLVNEVTPHYAEFGAEPGAPDDGAGFQPDFGFVRYFGKRLESALPEKDRRWVIDQVMAAEVPAALGIVRSSMRDLYEPSPGPARRSAMNGD